MSWRRRVFPLRALMVTLLWLSHAFSVLSLQRMNLYSAHAVLASYTEAGVGCRARSVPHLVVG